MCVNMGAGEGEAIFSYNTPHPSGPSPPEQHHSSVLLLNERFPSPTTGYQRQNNNFVLGGGISTAAR
jgi:hypothetical protein